MKSTSLLRSATAWLAFTISSVLTLALQAHPGHYHPPGEEDEFDALRADWLHLHGALEISMALTAALAAVVFTMSKSKAVRLGAALAFTGALTLIAAN